MHLQIADIEGSVLDTFEDLETAARAFRVMVAEDVGAMHDLRLLIFTDDGKPIGDALDYSELLKKLPPCPAETSANQVAPAFSRRQIPPRIWGKSIAPGRVPEPA